MRSSPEVTEQWAQVPFMAQREGAGIHGAQLWRALMVFHVGLGQDRTTPRPLGLAGMSWKRPLPLAKEVAGGLEVRSCF